MTPMKPGCDMLELLSEDQYPQWDAFVAQARGGTIFHTSYFLRPLARKLKIFVLRGEDGGIEGGIALTLVAIMGCKAARRPAWTAYNGPLARASEKQHPGEKASEEKAIVLRLLAGISDIAIQDYIFAPDAYDVIPFIWNGFETLVGYTYQIPPGPVDQWQAAMSQDHRRSLRKAHESLKNLGGEVEVTTDFDECHSLLSETFAAKDFSVRAGKSLLGKWWRSMVEHRAGAIYLARDAAGRPVCCTIMIWDDRCAYYLAGGIRADARRGPMEMWSRVLFDRMIRDSHQRDLTFDFEGSVLPGVERFFRGWGGRCVPKYRAVKLRRLWAYAVWVGYRFLTCHRIRRWFEEP